MSQQRLDKMTTIKIFAGTNIGLRDNNEDNFTVCPDLTLSEWMVPASQQDKIPLGKKGCLIVVADGMGGMNAGEVASDIAIKTVQQMFASAVLPANIVDKPESIKAYLKKVIIQADAQIKQHCKDDPTTEGMGSTIVIAWLYESNIYIAWLGDSRAYSYIPNKGISRLSKDHSYVQQLVDAKMITEDEAMVHPQSNVITRSLGDTSQKAKPDVVCQSVTTGEIILLCSDGLCGVCTDAEIADILAHNESDLQECKEALTKAALVAGGSDNITVALLQIEELNQSVKVKNKHYQLITDYIHSWKDLLALIFGIFLIVSLIFACFCTYGGKKNQEDIPVDSVTQKDSKLIDDSIKVHPQKETSHTTSNSSSPLQEYNKKRKRETRKSPEKNKVEESGESHITRSESAEPNSTTKIE